MTEIVEYRSEGTIPELESMLQLLFEKDEVQTIINTRRDFEYKLRRAQKRKEDCIKYIEYELKLMKIIRLRHKKKLPQQKNAKLINLEMALKNRINNLFISTIQWFPQDLKVWVSYLRFCRQMRMFAPASRVLEQLLELHGSTLPEVYKMAANWESKDCKNVEKARKFLLKGVHTHRDNKMLLKEAFQLELSDADSKRKECKTNSLTIDPSNALVTSKKAEVIYECSMKKLKDVELMNDLLNICAKYDFTNNLQKKISEDMYEFDTDERMWDIFARRELNVGSEIKLSPKEKIAKCVVLYETATKRLNTEKMWSLYLDTLVEISKDNAVLPNYKRKITMSTLQKAASAGKLTEKYYLIWVGYLQGPEKHKRLVEVLQGAVTKLPESGILWLTLLRIHLAKGEDKSASLVFEQGVEALGAASLPLWKLMLQFEQTKRKNKIEELYKKSFTQCPEVAGHLKPMYLEWLVLTHGIVQARKAYDAMVQMPPPCLEMLKKMIYLETIQPNLNMKRLRPVYTLACVQFGDTNIGVWMDFCKFEMTSGEAARVSDIYWKARQHLEANLVESFLSEFSLLNTVPHSMLGI